MTTSTTEIRVPEATDVALTDESLTVELSDGRTISVPLAWYPRLTHATPEERSRWRLIGRGEGIHWTDLDEDISVEGREAVRREPEIAEALAGTPSKFRLVAEPTSSFQHGRLHRNLFGLESPPGSR